MLGGRQRRRRHGAHGNRRRPRILTNVNYLSSDCRGVVELHLLTQAFQTHHDRPRRLRRISLCRMQPPRPGRRDYTAIQSAGNVSPFLPTFTCNLHRSHLTVCLALLHDFGPRCGVIIRDGRFGYHDRVVELGACIASWRLRREHCLHWMDDARSCFGLERRQGGTMCGKLSSP